MDEKMSIWWRLRQWIALKIGGWGFDMWSMELAAIEAENAELKRRLRDFVNCRTGSMDGYSSLFVPDTDYTEAVHLLGMKHD
jgi:hypothetical protein